MLLLLSDLMEEESAEKRSSHSSALGTLLDRADAQDRLCPALAKQAEMIQAGELLWSFDETITQK